MRLILAAALLAPLAAQAAPSLCIQAYRIDHTERPDDRQVLFYMRDRTVYRAHVKGLCVGLANDPRGFTYEPTPGSDEICSNLWTLKLNTTGAFCMMGAFEKVTK
jgi:hypothetical protein